MPHKPSRLEFISIRGLRYCVRHWGDPAAPAIFLLHGWMDSSATFQFVVDALQQEWHLIAPDWRGYGQSDYLNRPYWFPDYYADLDALLAHYSPQAPVRLVGHSMGANIGSIYAGTRPERVAALIMVDFLGLLATDASTAPRQLGQWLANQEADHHLRAYPDAAALARRLSASNPRLNADRAAFLAQNVSRPLPDGRLTMACDPWHKVPSPALYKIEDAMACWSGIRCPTLLLNADAGYVVERFGTASAELTKRLGCFRNMTVKTITDAGHNVQHDQPERLAAEIEAFFKQLPA